MPRWGRTFIARVLRAVPLPKLYWNIPHGFESIVDQ